MSAPGEARNGVRKRVLAADFERFLHSLPAGQLAHALLPIGSGLVVDGSDCAERLRSHQFLVVRAGNDRLRARRHSELQAEHGDTARSLQKHEVPRLHVAASDESIPGSDTGTGQCGSFLEGQMCRELHEVLLIHRHVLRQHSVQVAARHGPDDIGRTAADPALKEQ